MNSVTGWVPQKADCYLNKCADLFENALGVITGEREGKKNGIEGEVEL